jgi:uncharacterized protein (TIGR02147 family)
MNPFPSVFDYSDYRAFLSDSYEARKQVDPKFSHRYFSQKAGFKSSGFFANVLSGNRNLTITATLRFASALKLKKDERDYFQNMVGFCQAKTVEERSHFYEKMVCCLHIDIRKLAADKFEFYSYWYYSAIRELLFYYQFSGNYEGLAKQLCPPISAQEARKAIELLLRLGLICRQPDGTYHQNTPLITSGEGVTSLHITRFQRATMDLAHQALDRFSADVRDSTTLTMTLSSESFEKAKREVAELRKRLLAMAQSDMKVDRVYQFNFQLFPLTRIPRSSGGTP